jgi:hypothetical protein
VPCLSLAEENGNGGVGNGKKFVDGVGIELDSAAAAAAVKLGEENAIIGVESNMRVVAIPPCGIANGRGETKDALLRPFFLEGLVAIVIKSDYSKFISSLDKEDFLTGKIKMGLLRGAAKCFYGGFFIQKKIS